MKKIAFFAALLSLVATSSFGATVLFSATQDGYSLRATTPANLLIGKCSKGVRLAVTYDETYGTAYSMATVHKSGTKYYGSAYDSTAIMVSSPAGDINAAFAALPTSVGTTAFATGGWTAL